MVSPVLLPAAPPAPIAERTPEGWRDLLLPRLEAQRREISVPELYYDGQHPLQFATSKFREAFGSLFAAFADNWCPIVVDAPVERLAIIGFRVGENDEAGKAAWRLWQRNHLDVESVIAHTEAGKCGRAYLLVDPNNGDPRITVEHPQQMIVATDPGDRQNRLAALKQWAGDDGFWYATLYLPDYVCKWRSREVVRQGVEVEWIPRPDAQDGPNPLRVVPAIEISNAPGLLNGGESDLKPAIPIQNAVNKLCSDMLVASEFGAFRQRVLTGVEIPKDPDTGKPLAGAEVKAAMSRMWAFESADAKVTDLPPTDLSNFVSAIEMFVQHLAAQTHTPPHYLIGKVVNASGDALKAAEAGLTSKCRRKILYFSDPWEEAIALALNVTGIDVGSERCEVLWEDPEQQSLAQLMDAAVKARQIGVPLEMAWAKYLGFSPQEVADAKRLSGLPERPPPGATTAEVPPVLGGSTPPAGDPTSAA